MIVASTPGGNIFELACAVLVSLAFSLSLPARGQEKAEHRAGLLFDGTYDQAEVARKIEGAHHTQLVAAHEWDYGVKNFTRAEWEEQKLDWDSYLTGAKKLADEIAGRVKPELVRDSRGVIQYAVLREKDPFLSSVILSPHFLKIFAETLGDQLQVVVVDRNLLYVFPADGGQLEEYGPAIVEHFRAAPLRVSLEVFLVNKRGFRVVGELERN